MTDTDGRDRQNILLDITTGHGGVKGGSRYVIRYEGVKRFCVEEHLQGTLNTMRGSTTLIDAVTNVWKRVERDMWLMADGQGFAALRQAEADNDPEPAAYEPTKIVIDNQFRKGPIFIAEKKLNLMEYRDLRVQGRFMRYVECTSKLCLWDNGPGRVEDCIDSIDVTDEKAASERAENWFNDIVADPERTPNHIFVAPTPE